MSAACIERMFVLFENDGRQLWVDVKVITTKPRVGIQNALCQAEVAKCKQYGQGPPERHMLHGRMIPFVVEAHGKLAPMAETITSYLITRQAKVIEEKRDISPSAALRQASEQFWEPLACQLLTATLAWTRALCQRARHGRVSDT